MSEPTIEKMLTRFMASPDPLRASICFDERHRGAVERHLRRVALFEAVAEAARKVSSWIGEGGVIMHPTEGGYTTLHEALTMMADSLAALDAASKEAP